MKRLTLTNDFHGTTVTVHPSADRTLSLSQVRRVWRQLCGIKTCTCGDNGIRGPQPLNHEWLPDGRLRFVEESRP